MSEREILLKVEGLNKKFATDIKHNLFYGFTDLLKSAIGTNTKYSKLRNKEFWALKNVNLNLSEGEILGIVGENGSGKTTLMRVISNIYPLDMGQIYYNKNHTIAPIFAVKGGLQNLFTGRENVFIKGAMYGMSKSEISRKLQFVEEFAELGNKFDMPLGNYSSGMKTRLAFAITMSVEPNVFIIDEALAVGDSLFQTKCFEYLKEYVKKPKRAVLFISNNTKKVLHMATRLLVMDKGEIILNSSEIKSALHFYIKNCMNVTNEIEKEELFNKVMEYDL